MSLEHYQSDARRWLLQARADLKAGRDSRANGSHEWACFQSQQAGEKALKAIWLFHAIDPWGHSLVKLIRDWPGPALRESLDGLLPEAKELDKLYIPTRYPNGLPDLTPAEVYTDRNSQDALSAAEIIILFAAQVLDSA